MLKRTWRVENIKKTVVLGALIFIGIAIVFYFFVLNPQPQNFAIGEEIKSFPTENVSLTLTSLNITKNFRGYRPSYGSNNTLVVFNFTLRSIADTEIYTLENFPHEKMLLLKYDGYYAQYRTWSFWETNLSLMPNQSIKGWMFYEILEGYEPNTLVYPKESPEVFVKISE